MGKNKLLFNIQTLEKATELVYFARLNLCLVCVRNCQNVKQMFLCNVKSYQHDLLSQ